MRRVALLLSLAAIPLFARAQDQPALLFIDSVIIIGRMEGGLLYSGPGVVSHTLAGNSLYSGVSEAREDLLYLIALTDPYGRKDEAVYFDDARQVAFSMSRGELFLGQVSEPDLERLLRVSAWQDGFYQVSDGQSDAYLGTIAVAAPLRAAELFSCLHSYVLHYDLDQQVNARIDERFPATGNGQPSAGRIRPLQGNNPYYEWEWDGRVLKPSWGVRSEDEWSFDGRFIRPLFGVVSRQEWVWDGRLLKPYWDPEPSRQWIWDYNSLRPFWNASPADEWVLQDSVLRPRYNADPGFAWVIEGNIPLPLLAMVILGLADR